MLKSSHLCKVKSVNKLMDTIFLLEIEISDIAEEIEPGQFFHIKCGEGYLRRPVSVCDVENNLLKIAFEVRGKGTRALSETKEGDVIDVLGPLGNGFKTKGGSIAVVGGGIGVFPLLYLLKKSNALKKEAILGFPCIDRIVLEREFKDAADHLTITCNDGSYGIQGFVTDALKPFLEKEKPEIIYTCGPDMMMRNVYEICRKYNIPCQVSLEERMGCGIGACLVCACAQKNKEGERNIRVCKDGPVMWANEVYYD